MGNSQAKEAKEKKPKKEIKRKDEDSDVDNDEEEVEAAAFIELEICQEFPHGSTSTFEMKPYWNNTLAEFKLDLQKKLKTTNRLDVYRNTIQQPLGPDHLTLQVLQLESGDMLSVKELDN